MTTSDFPRRASSDRGSGPYLWRFSPLQRVLHLMVVVSFFGLVMTGVPLAVFVGFMHCSRMTVSLRWNSSTWWT